MLCGIVPFVLCGCGTLTCAVRGKIQTGRLITAELRGWRGERFV